MYKDQSTLIIPLIETTKICPTAGIGNTYEYDKGSVWAVYILVHRYIPLYHMSVWLGTYRTNSQLVHRYGSVRQTIEITYIFSNKTI